MIREPKHLNIIPLFVLLLVFAFPAIVFSGQPLKVFILAGQSNMQGHGELTDGAQGNLQYMVDTDPATFGHLKSGGDWAVRDDVWIYYERDANTTLKGGLTAGMGAFNDTIGPELQFGNVIGDLYDGQVLLIKTAWGGKSLAVDYRPPSSGGDVGPYYTLMLNIVNDVLANLSTHFPAYNPADGYEIAGFGWHQGWNDRVNQAYNDEYEFNMKNFINDVRAALGVPLLPFVIATTGMSGWDETHPRALSLMEAQLAMADTNKYPEFEGNVAVVETRGFYRPPEESPSSQGYHWNRNAETYFLIGNGIGEEMAKLRASLDLERPIANPFGPVFLDLINNELLWEKQISPTVTEYCYRMKVKSVSFETVENVTVKTSSVPENITVMNGKVFFGSLPRLQETSSIDTFTIRVDSSLPGGVDDIMWEISDEPEPRPTGDITYDFAVKIEDMELLAANWLNVIQPDELTGFWALGDNGSSVIDDISDNGNDGTAVGAPTHAEGIAGSALYFDGIDDHIAVDNFSITGNEFTFVAWMKGSGPDFAGIVSTRNPVFRGMFIGPNGQLRYSWNDLSQQQWAWDLAPVIPQDQWAMVALVIEPDKATAYVYTEADGLQFGVNAVAHDVMTMNNIKIGWEEGLDTRRFTGLIGNAAIYNRALSLQEIQNLCDNPSLNPIADINRDGVVNLSDLVEIAEHWQTEN